MYNSRNEIVTIIPCFAPNLLAVIDNILLFVPFTSNYRK